MAVFTWFVWFSPAAASAAGNPATFDLTILHTNDIHGHLLPFPYLERGRRTTEDPSRGGAARRAVLIHRLERSSKNPFILVDSGDIATRWAFCTTYEGLADVTAMNAVGYQVAAIGNNEFKLKDAVDQADSAGAQADLVRVVKRSSFPWVCANATDGKGGILPGVHPFVVKKVGPLRVGFLGLTAPRSASYPQTKGWIISDPIAAAKEWIPKARANCDVLIALTHLGTPLDALLAAQTTGIDAIVGGDSHTFLYEPLTIPNAQFQLVPIVQDGEFGVDLGRFDLHFEQSGDGKWKLSKSHDELLPIDSTLPEDAGVKKALGPFIAPFRQVVARGIEVGTTAQERRRLTTQIVVDAMRSAAAADVAMCPAGDGMFETFRSKTVTRYDVYCVMPFKDHMVTAIIPGTEIKSLMAGSPATVLSGLKSFDDARDYRVALVDFGATNSYGLAANRLTDTGKDVREVVINYLRGLTNSR